MQQFIEKYRAEILGSLSGFDRLVFRAAPRRLQQSYWDAGRQCEWATDVVFRRAEFLKRLMQVLVPHGMLSLSSTDVLRYFGKRVTESGEIPERFNGELQNVPVFQSYRAKQGGPSAELKWRPMCKRGGRRPAQPGRGFPTRE